MLQCGTTNEQLKIELLSQWKLEAEFRNFGHEFPEKMQPIFPKPGARGWGKGGQKLFGVFLEIHPLLREETMG